MKEVLFMTKISVNQITGEINDFSSEPHAESRFLKMYHKMFLPACYQLSNAEFPALFYIIGNMDTKTNCIHIDLKSEKKNKYKKTSVTLAELHLSKSSFYNALKRFQELDIIRKIQRGFYMINPNMLSTGRDSTHYCLIKQYEAINQIELDDHPEKELPKSNPMDLKYARLE